MLNLQHSCPRDPPERHGLSPRLPDVGHQVATALLHPLVSTHAARPRNLGPLARREPAGARAVLRVYPGHLQLGDVDAISPSGRALMQTSACRGRPSACVFAPI